MCSNTSSSCGGAGGGHFEYSTSGSRNQKRQRIPKRGPGVAELEKILREQENRDDMKKWVIGSFVSSPNSLQKNFSLPQDHNRFSPPLPPVVTGLFGTGTGDVKVNLSGGTNSNAGSQLGDARIGVSGRIPPENHLGAPPRPLPQVTTLFPNASGGGNLNSNVNGNSQLGGGNGGNIGNRGIDMGGSAMVSPCVNSGVNCGGRGVDRCGSALVLSESYHFSPPCPPVTAFCKSAVNYNCNPQSIGSKGIDIGGSHTVLPENILIPKIWDCGDRTDGDCPKTASDLPFPVHFLDQNQMVLSSPSMLQKKHWQGQPSMMNFFPNPVLPSSSTSSSEGLYQHHLEPPSNQRSRHTSTLPEEEIKMAGGKRPRPFSTGYDNPPPAPPPPPLHSQLPSLPPPLHRLDPSYLVGDHGAFNLGTTSTSRDRIQSDNLELNMRSTIADYGTNSGNNGIIFGSPTTPSPSMQTCQQEFFKVKPLPSQEFKESCEGSRAYRRHVADGLGQRQPFYCFLQPEEEMNAAETKLSSRERGETREDGIDLNLKL